MILGRLPPLPIRTRVFGGETLTSYARRLATRNHLSVAEIDRWLRRTGVVSSGSARHPARVEAYRQLGGLDRSAFTTPARSTGTGSATVAFAWPVPAARRRGDDSRGSA